MGKNDETVVFPDDLSALSLRELSALSKRAQAEFDALADDDELDDDGVERLETLAVGIENLATAMAGRGKKKRKPMADDDENDMPRGMATKTTAASTDDSEPESEDDDDDADDDTDTDDNQEVREQVTTASGPGRNRKKASLQAAQERAPKVPDTEAGNDLTITAAAPIAGRAIGSEFSDLGQLAEAFTAHSKGLVTSHGNPGFLTVASVKHNFDHTIHGDRTSHSEFDSMLKDLRSSEKVEDLVAGGGWCAPSQIRYDFFDITCQDGMIDLPTFGVERGGIQFPVSPSLADVFTGTFTNATNPWLWTEADDILSATGSPTKPCVRVLCPDFDNERLECYGICLTAGNLTDSAYPEAVRHHLGLLMAAHFHAQNQRYIQRMVALSTAAIAFPSGWGSSILSDAPSAAAIAAQDYRTRFGMCDDDVLEMVLPRWVRDAMRDDHLRRNGFWASPLTDAEIDALFSARRVRIQWVNDWQIRGTGQPGQASASAITGWPDSVDFLVYAAGTFIRGNGLTLDLGVVRDSVLNETNDHTASWTEECHLIARVGHESRRYTLPVCVAGRTGAADVTDCHVGATE